MKTRIDWSKPLRTAIPEEVVVVLHRFESGQLVQVTGEGGHQSLYLVDEFGGAILLFPRAPRSQERIELLFNVRSELRVPEFFINIYEEGPCGSVHRSAQSAMENRDTARAHRACLRFKIALDPANHLVVFCIGDAANQTDNMKMKNLSDDEDSPRKAPKPDAPDPKSEPQWPGDKLLTSDDSDEDAKIPLVR